MSVLVSLKRFFQRKPWSTFAIFVNGYMLQTSQLPGDILLVRSNVQPNYLRSYHPEPGTLWVQHESLDAHFDTGTPDFKSIATVWSAYAHTHPHEMFQTVLAIYAYRELFKMDPRAFLRETGQPSFERVEIQVATDDIWRICDENLLHKLVVIWSSSSSSSSSFLNRLNMSHPEYQDAALVSTISQFALESPPRPPFSSTLSASDVVVQQCIESWCNAAFAKKTSGFHELDRHVIQITRVMSIETALVIAVSKSYEWFTYMGTRESIGLHFVQRFAWKHVQARFQKWLPIRPVSHASIRTLYWLAAAMPSTTAATSATNSTEELAYTHVLMTDVYWNVNRDLILTVHASDPFRPSVRIVDETAITSLLSNPSSTMILAYTREGEVRSAAFRDPIQHRTPFVPSDDQIQSTRMFDQQVVALMRPFFAHMITRHIESSANNNVRETLLLALDKM